MRSGHHPYQHPLLQHSLSLFGDTKTIKTPPGLGKELLAALLGFYDVAIEIQWLAFVGGGALLYVLSRYEIIAFASHRVPSLGGWLDWAYMNLGSSIPVFAALLLAFFFTLARLRRLLETGGSINRIVQLDQLTDIWTTLFFGTGVIWTAIGMRSALIFALGDPDASINEGAFAILERMVEEGKLGKKSGRGFYPWEPQDGHHE